MIYFKSLKEIESIRAAGLVVAEVLLELKDRLVPGITTKDLDLWAAESIHKKGGKSADLGYHGYPAHICVSVNEQLVHGIPSGRVINEGDIVSIDVTVIKNGWHGDAAVTIIVGNPDAIPESHQRLVKVTADSLSLGIEQAVVGNRIGDISHAVQAYVEKHGFSVIREMIGHGIGRSMHEDPPVPNYGSPGRGPRLLEGMVLAIEPMVSMGRPDIRVLDDGWTVVMKDGMPSAHFEHTVAVTKDGPVILTSLN